MSASHNYLLCVECGLVEGQPIYCWDCLLRFPELNLKAREAAQNEVNLCKGRLLKAQASEKAIAQRNP